MSYLNKTVILFLALGLSTVSLAAPHGRYSSNSYGNNNHSYSNYNTHGNYNRGHGNYNSYRNNNAHVNYNYNTHGNYNAYGNNGYANQYNSGAYLNYGSYSGINLGYNSHRGNSYNLTIH